MHLEKENMKKIMKYLYASIKDISYLLKRGFILWIPQNFLFPKPKKDLNKIKILLVHGYGDHESCWYFFRRYLQKNGGDYAYTLNLGLPFSSLTTYVKCVEKTIEKITDSGDRVILIGHSMGGLICSDYATTESGRKKVLGVITLGSPLRGSMITHWAYGVSAKEMKIGSLYIEKLNKKILTTSTVKFFQYFSGEDLIVLPSSHGHSFKNNPTHVVSYEKSDLGHLGFLCDQKIFSHISTDIQELKSLFFN